ncbi:hypothetical protein HNY73_005468 [Argiope bruennichi]|uniref:Uncharacterized protein n=1 Tax=Argiope bruennichi TaxID=94029 RepID=A0A8T0FLK4_ARGBR|nr:hypothetical protein HNY73_005468 [Argiope bruennichi]
MCGSETPTITKFPVIRMLPLGPLRSSSTSSSGKRVWEADVTLSGLISNLTGIRFSVLTSERSSLAATGDTLKMEWKHATIFAVLSLFCLVRIHAKIVYINGTEVFNEKISSHNVTTKSPVRAWYSVFNPKNISNHSGHLTIVHRKEDAEEKEVRKEVEKFQDHDQEESQNDTLATRDTTLLSSLRGIWSDLSPMLTVLSTFIGIFLMFILLESPLSPLPVPPLPHSPVGPYPPTNMYPFGIPPPRNYYGVGYAGPPRHASYRNPRYLKRHNTTMDEVLEKLEKGLQILRSEDLWKNLSSL